MSPSHKMLSLLFLPSALLARALPLLNTHGDLQVFANAFLGSATGGAFSTCDAIGANLDVSLVTGLGLTTSRARAVNNWALGQCFSAYHDTDFCSEISAFISATYYAYESGWYGADLLAVLGVDRVNRWNDVLAHLCRAPGCPANTCDTLTSHWNGFYDAFTGVSASAYGYETLELQAAGILAMIDATASVQLNKRHLIAAQQGSANAFGDLKLGNGKIVAAGKFQGQGSVNVERNLVVAGQGDLNGSDKLQLEHETLNAGAKLGSKGELLVDRAYSNVAAKGSAAVSAFAGVKLGHHELVNGGADLEAHGSAFVGRDVSKVSAKGAIGASALSDIDLGRHDRLKTDFKADAHASAFIGRHFPEIVAAGSTQGGESAGVGLTHHDLISASSSDSAKGPLLVSRGTPDVIIAGSSSISSTDKVHLSHGIAATDASSIHGSGVIAVTRSLPLSEIDAFTSGSSLNSLRQGTGGLQANSLTKAMGSVFGDVSMKRNIVAAGEGAVDAGKIVQAEGSGFVATSKNGVVSESEIKLKAGAIKVEGSAGGNLAAH